jgi:putative colanic acid biosysnthesis UDP-glucose lipid carrier transferase
MQKVSSGMGKKNITSSYQVSGLTEPNISTGTVLPDFNGESYLSEIFNFRKTATVSFVSVPLEFPVNRIIKRLIDIFIAMTFIACILSWLMPIIAILIKIDSKGPIFFFQKRNKKNSRIFTCIKFRSMIVNAEADLVQAKEDDNRITRFGMFLRKYHVDELPQFINVLFGDMSVIGPRPHMISDNLKYQELISHYSSRCGVKPGITGLAQVSGYAGPVTDIEKMKIRVQMDNFYIRHWSLKLDMMILCKTGLKTIRLDIFP